MSIPIGTCSNCSGMVTVPEHWYSTLPPVATCERCRATRKRDYGPVIPMNPPPSRVPPVPGQGPSWRHEDELMEWPGGSRILDNLLRKSYPKGGIL